MSKSNENWIEWKGGECPVEDHVKVAVRFPSGNEYDHATAGQWNWKNGNGICAYRRLSPAPLNPPEWSKGFHDPENVKDPGEGYRFLILEEYGKLGEVAQFYSMDNKEWIEVLCAPLEREMGWTYRVPKNTPFPDPPASPAPWTLSRHLPGFRALVDGEEWHQLSYWKEEDLIGGWRPLLNEIYQKGDEFRDPNGAWFKAETLIGQIARTKNCLCRTKRPLPDLSEPVKATAPDLTKSHQDDLVDTMRALNPTRRSVSYSSITQPLTQTNTDNTMNTQNPNNELIGTRWLIAYDGITGFFKATIVGQDENGLLLNSRRFFGLLPDPVKIEHSDWQKRIKSKLPTKLDKGEQTVSGRLTRYWRFARAVALGASFYHPYTAPLWRAGRDLVYNYYHQIVG